MTSIRVAVIGLGSMGFGMARSLLAAGHKVWGVDRRPEPVSEFQRLGGDTLAFDQAVPVLDVAVLVVLNAPQAEAVLFGDDGIAPRMKPGACVMLCATVPPDFARAAALKCGELGLHYLDAPISGGAAKAALGQLSIMASGTPDAFAKARPALDAMAETVFELGDEAGPGSAMKSVNQLLAGVHIAATAEAITFGISQGISPEKFMEIIPRCAGTSWMLENRGPHVRDADYTPRSSVDIWPKDLGIVLDTARAAKFAAPLTAAALQQFLAAAGSGLGRQDDAAVAKVYARNAGLKLPGD